MRRTVRWLKRRAQYVIDWLLQPVSRVYVVALFIVLAIAGSITATTLSSVDHGARNAIHRVHGLAIMDAANEKSSIQSRVSTVRQRCVLTQLIADTQPEQTTKTHNAFTKSISKCLKQLGLVEALNARTP